jgi:hypothetical protein
VPDEQQPPRNTKRPIGFVPPSAPQKDTAHGQSEGLKAEDVTTESGQAPPTPPLPPNDTGADEKALKELQDALKQIEQNTGIQIEDIHLSGSHPALEQMNQRVFGKLRTTEQRKKDRFDSHNPQNHPRFKEWERFCKDQFRMAHEANLPKGTLRLPSFHLWLRHTEEEEERIRNRPKIRGDNPPLANKRAAKSFFNRIFRPGYVNRLLKTWPLHAYTHSFETILADESKLNLSVCFQIPSERQHLSDELDRITHKELLLFMKRHSKRPSDDEIREHLHWELVSFQDENDIPILRVDITATERPNTDPSPSPGGIYV